MKNLIKFLQFGTTISLIMVIIISVLPQKGFAQIEMLPDGTEVYNLTGFDTDKYKLTESMKESLRKLVTGPAGYKEKCESGQVITLLGYSDYQRYRNVSKEVSDRLNDLLANQRRQSVARYAIDELGMSEACFIKGDGIYADSKIRGVGFAVVDRTGGSFLYKRLALRVDSTEGILSQIQQEIADLHEKNKEQDKRLDEHEVWIRDNTEANKRQYENIHDHEERLTALENRSWNVSGHIGVNAEYFADQFAPTISTGIKVGQFELAGWFGYMQNSDTEELDIGLKNLNRLTYGGLATWYYDVNSWMSLGPSIGYEHGEDIIEGRNSYVKSIDSAILGGTVDVEIAGPLHLRVNAAWTPVLRFNTYKSMEFEDMNFPFRGSIGLSINFN